jgi:hypothetical protein
MFLRTIKVIKKQSKTEFPSSDETLNHENKSLKKHTFNSIENFSEIRRSSKKELNPEYQPLPTWSPYNINKNRLQSFQN